jgi:hypothetical protein
MAIATVSGAISLSDVKWIPEVYAPNVQAEFYRKSTLPAICNTDYEKLIQDWGDTVWIRTLPEFTFNDYVIGQKLKYTRVVGGKIALLIDKGQYFAFPANLVEDVQSDIAKGNRPEKTLIEVWVPHGAQGLKRVIDAAVYEYMYNQAHASNQGATAGVSSGGYNMGAAGSARQVTKADIVDYVCECNAVMDEFEIPDDDGNRFVTLPAWAGARLKVSDVGDASKMGDKTSILRNGIITEIDRSKIVVSNALKSVLDGGNRCWYAPFGHRAATTFATQITKKETLANPDDFGNLFRMLQVYGRKVVMPKALGMGYIRK